MPPDCLAHSTIARTADAQCPVRGPIRWHPGADGRFGGRPGDDEPRHSPEEARMSPKDRAVFVAAYSRLVAEVWADPAKERALEQDSRALLASYGLTVP